MNIGSLIRGLLGDSKPGEPKSVELKEGQVVRGVVLSVSDSGKEAVVQIQGTPVRAELEAPLQPGQTLNLQVAPPGDGGLPVLKPVSPGNAAIVSPQSMGEALEMLGLSDVKAGREIVLAMQSGGLALTKETAEQLNAIMNAKPPGVPADQWLEAAVISVKRGLPVTPESVRGLQQAVFGPPLHQLLSALEEQLELWAKQGDLKGGNVAEGTGKGAGGNIPGTGVSGGTGTPSAAAAQPSQTGAPQPAGGQAPASGPAGAAQPNAQIPSQTSATGVAPASSMGTGPMGEQAEPPSPAANSGLNAGVSGAGSTGNTVNPSSSGTNLVDVNNTNMRNAGALASTGETAPEQQPAATSTNGAATGKEANAANSIRAGAEGGLPQAASRSAVAGTGAEVRPGAEPGAASQPAETEAGRQTAGPPAERSGTALLAKLQGVLSELRGSLPQLGDVPPALQAGPPKAPAAAAPPQGHTAPPAGAAGQEQPAQAAPRGEASAAGGTPQPGPAPAHDSASWVGRVLKLLGAEHEQQAVRGSGAAAAEARPAAVNPAANVAAGAGSDSAETLKGVLLQAISSSDVPPAVKDIAGQLVQQLTGQQLLLNTDRTAPFAQVTLFLPLHGQDGQETASVHIQSRRGRKGELDAANCRLWFDLDMKQMGQTLVDVHVVDRMVSLKMHNNHPVVLGVLEQRREEIASAVESIGYQLLSMRTEPLPDRSTAIAESNANLHKLTDYVPDSYKGVDYRI